MVRLQFRFRGPGRMQTTINCCQSRPATLARHVWHPIAKATAGDGRRSTCIGRSRRVECAPGSPARQMIMTRRSGAPAVVGEVPLPDADFTDAYSVHVAKPLDAIQAARRMVERRPRWVNGPLMLRNIAVTPFGLKRGVPLGAER